MTSHQSIQNHINQLINTKENANCECEGAPTLTRLDGKSGNQVYLVKHNNQSCYVIKVFLQRDERQYEIKSYEFLRQNGFKTVKVLKCFDDDVYHYMCLEWANGQPISKIVKVCADDHDKLYTIGSKLGLLLRRIHEIRKISVNQHVTKSELLELIRFTKVNSLIRNEFLLNPGQFTYVHGDPSLDNLIIDNDSTNVSNIIIIDPGQLIKNTKDDMPRGFPGCDYNRFIFAAQLIAKRDKIHSIVHIIDGFKEGYGPTYTIFTKEANLLFGTYWNKVLHRHLNKMV